MQGCGCGLHREWGLGYKCVRVRVGVSMRVWVTVRVSVKVGIELRVFTDVSWDVSPVKNGGVWLGRTVSVDASVWVRLVRRNGVQMS